MKKSSIKHAVGQLLQWLEDYPRSFDIREEERNIPYYLHSA